MLNEKRERLQNAGKTPRTTPAPAAAYKRKSWRHVYDSTCGVICKYSSPLSYLTAYILKFSILQYFHCFYIYSFPLKHAPEDIFVNKPWYIILIRELFLIAISFILYGPFCRRRLQRHIFLANKYFLLSQYKLFPLKKCIIFIDYLSNIRCVILTPTECNRVFFLIFTSECFTWITIHGTKIQCFIVCNRIIFTCETGYLLPVKIWGEKSCSTREMSLHIHVEYLI